MTLSIMRIAPRDGDDARFECDPPTTSTALRLSSHVRRALVHARGWVLSQQHAQGCWAAEAHGPATLESQYILLLAHLGEANTPRAKAAARRIIHQQLPTGGWAAFPGGPLDLSGSLQAYFALKLTGHEPHVEYMQRAREAIRSAGGADAADGPTRLFLALLGQIPYDARLAAPPQSASLPDMPLSIVAIHQPLTQIEPRLGVRELFITHPEQWPPVVGPSSLTRLDRWMMPFRTWRHALKCKARRQVDWLRKRALIRAERWILNRLEDHEGTDRSFSALVWSLVALKCLNSAKDSPAIRRCREQLEELMVEDGEQLRLQPCESRWRDTAIAARTLSEAGIFAEDESMIQATQWLLDRSIWSSVDRAGRPGIGAEDVALLVMALQRQFSPSQPSHELPVNVLRLGNEGQENETRNPVLSKDRGLAALSQAERWLLAMQNGDGGWGASANARGRSPGDPYITACALEALGALGHRVGDHAVDRAVAYLRTVQEADGSWPGREGANHIQGVSQAICGLIAVGIPADDPAIVAAANWLLGWQQACGGWGEAPAGYQNPRLRGQGTVTASQTAWALLGLISAGLVQHSAVAHGIRLLISEQTDEGHWYEPEFTIVGNGGEFHRNSLYANCPPLRTLAGWLEASRFTGDGVELPPTPRCGVVA